MPLKLPKRKPIVKFPDQIGSAFSRVDSDGRHYRAPGERFSTQDKRGEDKGYSTRRLKQIEDFGKLLPEKVPQDFDQRKNQRRKPEGKLHHVKETD
ncbi:MAG TPA: hypothetical protein VFF13_01945 [archaeon]|nr:hypothetical protein [archaeon]